MKKVVIKNNSKEVDINDIYLDNIYAFFTERYCGCGQIYKLQKYMSNDYQRINQCMFVSIEHSQYTFYGHKITNYMYPEDIIRQVINDGYTVYEFKDIKEFSKWCQEVLSKREG